MRLLALLLGLAPLLGAANWYVRPDGGTAAQCTGLADAAYPGSGAAQACAFSHPYYLFTNDTGSAAYSWKIAGGDTVLLKNNSNGSQAQYRFGYKSNASTGYWRFGGSSATAQCIGDPFSCAMPPPPNGSVGNPTRIVGEGWDTDCSGTKVQLHGGVGVNQLINLSGSQYVSIQCFEMTDHAQVGSGASGEPTVTSGFPKTDHALRALRVSASTSNLELKHLNIHGFAAQGIYGAAGNTISLDDVTVNANKSAGWDMDDGSASVGPLTITNSEFSGNGCVEEYPLSGLYVYPWVHCYGQGTGGYGDAIGTITSPNMSVTVTDTRFYYNTSDALDFLYLPGTGTIIAERNYFIGNVGQAIKTGGSQFVYVRNNYVVENCRRIFEDLPGAPSTWNDIFITGSVGCRAGGAIAIRVHTSGDVALENNTVYTYADTTLQLTCGTAASGQDCSAATVNVRNNVWRGYDYYLAGGDLPGLVCADGCIGQTYTMPSITYASNYVCGHKTTTNWTCASESGGYCVVNSCPVTGWITSEPSTIDANNVRIPDEAAFDTIDGHVPATSPLKDSGLTIAAVTVDIRGVSRPQFAAYDVGAYEYSNADVAPTIITVSPLDGGAIGTPYALTLVATGDAPIAWTVDSGALPTGLSMSSGGIISGTPSGGGGLSTFVARASNGAGSHTRTFTITIGAPPTITTASLPNGTAGVTYSQTISTTGTSPIVVYVSPGSTAPPGLSVASNGVMSGVPTTAGTYTFDVGATNGLSPDALQSYTVTIAPPIPRSMFSGSRTVTGAGSWK